MRAATRQHRRASSTCWRTRPGWCGHRRHDDHRHRRPLVMASPARLMPYETWYFVHLTGYLAVLLGFGHQLTLGTDFMGDRWPSGGGAAVHRHGPRRHLGSPGRLLRSLTRRLRDRRVAQANGIGSCTCPAPGCGALPCRVASTSACGPSPTPVVAVAPLSLSAAPTTAGLRFTIRSWARTRRDCSSVNPRHPRAGTGCRPCHGSAGRFRGQAWGSRRSARCWRTAAPTRPVVIVRVDLDDAAHRIELERLVASRDGSLHPHGRRQWFARHDPLPRDPSRLDSDIADRHVACAAPRRWRRRSRRAFGAQGSPRTSTTRIRV